ncbi:MAG: hypothetical protein EOO38_26230 [Cytophagaceae bacterium]|nr:MAG: hypothetical protein EOO38_26230 [Cytophagaceae bacterium]
MRGSPRLGLPWARFPKSPETSSVRLGQGRPACLCRTSWRHSRVCRPSQLLEAPRKTSEIHWVRPELVAAAEIAEWTASGKLRQASFKGLREDKRPEEVVRERPTAGAR